MLKVGSAKILLIKKLPKSMLILYLYCLFAPFPLWLIEQLLPYPYLIEELFKYFIVKNIPAKKNYWHPVILGIIFSFSETILYLVNFFQLGNFENIILRIILTTTLHAFLFFLLYSFRHRKIWSILSLIFTFIIHYLYNLYISKIFIF